MNTIKLVAATPVLATIADLAIGKRQHNGSLYFSVPNETQPQTELASELRMLLELGAGVKVLEGEHVWTLTIVDGAVVWHKRISRVTRDAWTTIQVVLN